MFFLLRGKLRLTIGPGTWLWVKEANIVLFYSVDTSIIL